MTNLLSKLQQIPFHHYLIALFPIAAFFANNAGQASLTDPARAALISVVAAVFSYAALRVSGVDARKAALALTTFLLAFYSYGHVYEGLKEFVPSAAQLVRHRYLAPLSIAAVILLIGLLLRARNIGIVTLAFNVCAIAMMITPAWQILSFGIEARQGAPSDKQVSTCHLAPNRATNTRDVYLLILDAYARDDVLRELHEFDNSPFLQELEARGFYIARGSLSNYRHTEMSLASTLNMNYIQDIPGSYTPSSQNRMGLVRLIQESQVRREFDCLGYNIVAFETGVFWTEWEDADFFITRHSGLMGKLRLVGGISRFEATLLETTAFRAIEDLILQLGGKQEPASDGSHSDHRDRVLFVFDEFEKAAQLPPPKFVFAHVLSPHPPMVLGSSGEAVNMGRFEDLAPDAEEEALIQAYADQVAYLNSRVLEVVDEILDNSATPPIIVIMGDHGWAERNPEDKLSILNAYYFPDGGQDELYPTMTPVNTFRIVFDQYFSADYGRLPDVSYFSTEADVYNFEVVENTWSGVGGEE